MAADKEDLPSQATKFENIEVVLTPYGSSKGQDSTRTIRLTKTNPTIKIGRSSKTASKNISVASDNAYFDSPVMSRTHAEVTVNFNDGSATLKDVGSLHGTSLNGVAMDKNVERPIKTGDCARFGIRVVRGFDVFGPAMIRFEITPNAAAPAVEQVRCYKAPEPTDDLSDGASDDDTSDDDNDKKDIHDSTFTGGDVLPGQTVYLSKAQSSPAKADAISCEVPAASTNSEGDSDQQASVAMSDFGENEGDDEDDHAGDIDNAANLDIMEAGFVSDSDADRSSASVEGYDEDEKSDLSGEAEDEEDDYSAFLKTELNRFDAMDSSFPRAPPHLPVPSTPIVHGLGSASCSGMRTPPDASAENSSDAASPVCETGTDGNMTNAAKDSAELPSPGLISSKKCNISSILNPSPPSFSLPNGRVPPQELTSLDATQPSVAAFADHDISKSSNAASLPDAQLDDPFALYSPFGEESGSGSGSFITEIPVLANASNSVTVDNPSSQVSHGNPIAKNNKGFAPSQVDYGLHSIWGQETEPEVGGDYLMDAAPYRPHKTELGRKRKADEMLVSDRDARTSRFVAAVKAAVEGGEAEEFNAAASASNRGVVQVAFAEQPSSAPAAKRQATSAAFLSRRTIKRRALAVAETLGIAALGGAVVLGSLIYSAPTF